MFISPQYLGAAFFIWHLWRKGRIPGGVRLRWVVSFFCSHTLQRMCVRLPLWQEWGQQ